MANQESETREAIVEYWGPEYEPWAGAGWYFYDKRYPGHGGWGAFASRELATRAARDEGFSVKEAS